MPNPTAPSVVAGTALASSPERAHAGAAPEAAATQTAPALTVLARSCGLLAAEGASIGIAGWSWKAPERFVSYVGSNAITAHARLGVVSSAVVGACVALACAAALAWTRRPYGLDAVRRLALRCAPLSLAMLLPLSFDWRLWVGRDLDFLVLTSFGVLGLLGLSRLSLSTAPVFPTLAGALRARLSSLGARGGVATRWLPIGLVTGAALAYTIYFARLTLDTHYRIETSVYDLGVENNLVWNAIHWGPLFRSTPLGGTMTHLPYHQTYFAYVIGLFYRFAPRPETLLVFQAAMLGFAALPLYFLGKRRLGPWVACLLSCMYLMYAPLHGSNLYDFHYQPLGVFFLWLSMYLLQERRDGWAALSILLTLSVREDMSLLLAVIGTYLLLTGERPRAGLIVAAIGACYFVALKLVIMPRFLHGESSYVNQYADLIPAGDPSFGGVLKTALANPGYTIKTLLEKRKLVYVLQLLTPLALLPLRRATGLLLLLPGFFFTLLSSHHLPSVSISFQYTAYWTPFVFIAAITHLDFIRLRQASGAAAPASYGAWLCVLPVAMLITSYQHGAILQHHTARTHFIAYRFGITPEDRKRHDDLYSLIAQVPKDAPIASAEWVVPQVSSRPKSYALRDDVYDAQYMILSLDVRSDELRTIRAALGSGQFGVVEQRGKYVLCKRGYDTSGNAALLAKLHD